MLIRTVHANGMILYQSPLLLRSGVPHAFTTRLGGVSERPFDSLNLGNPAGDVKDTTEHLRINHERVQAAIGCAGRRRRWVRQVHGDVIRIIDGNFEDGVDADALIGDDPRDLLSIRVADCAPVLMSTPDGRAVAAVHAGWRGTMAGIVPKAIEELSRHAGVRLAEIVVAIGPCIGTGAFEVGPEVWSIFRQRMGDGVVRAIDGGDRGLVDLAGAISLQLIGVGAAEANIDRTDRCTVTHADEFFSHRRDHGRTGRMAAFIGAAASANPS